MQKYPEWKRLVMKKINIGKKLRIWTKFMNIQMVNSPLSGNQISANMQESASRCCRRYTTPKNVPRSK